jgi:hypothetical protein
MLKSQFSLMLILTLFLSCLLGMTLPSAALSTIFYEGFESDVENSYPASFDLKYDGTGTANQKVIKTTAFDGTQGQVFQLEGAGGWASEQYYALQGSLPDRLVADAYIKPVTTSRNAELALRTYSYGDWGTRISSIWFEGDGTIVAIRNGDDNNRTVIGSYTVGQWYRVTLDHNFIDRTYDVYIDGIQAAEDLPMHPSYAPEVLSLISHNVTTSMAYFDNVGLYDDLPAVCSIGTQTYSTLDAALAEAVSGDTIKLLESITYPDALNISWKDITFDLNGYDLIISNETTSTGLNVTLCSVDFIGEGEFNVSGRHYGVYATGNDTYVRVSNAAGTAISEQSNGVYAFDGATIVVEGDATGDFRGAYSGMNGVAQVKGDAIATGLSGRAAFATTGGIIEAGNAVGTGENSLGAWAYENGQIHILGNASGTSFGAYTYGAGSSMIVDGNAISSNSIGAYAESETTLTVLGNAQGANAGALAYGSNAVLAVGGNAIATNTSGVGAQANAGGQVTIDGSIQADLFVRLDGGDYLSSQFTQPTTKTGYRTYTDGLNSVWVKLDYETWADGITTSDQYPFGGGDGTSASEAFEISSPYQLAQLAYNVNNGNTYSGRYFKLTSDLDLSGKEWVRIGKDYTNGFNGTFDGNEHKIEGLTITRLHLGIGYGHGLFGVLLNEGEISNLTIQSGVFHPSETPESNVGFGSIAGYNFGQIINCHNFVDLTADFDDVWVFAGGIAGMSDYGADILYCSNAGDVTIGNLGFAGGMIGYHLNGTDQTFYSNCHNSGAISGTGYAVVGGIGGKIGNLYGASGILNCSNSGMLMTGSTDGLSNQYYIGGLVGDLYGGPVINSYNTGDITVFYNESLSTEPLFAGGIVGFHNYADIINVYNTGSIIGPVDRIGWIAGHNAAAHSNCYALVDAINSTASPDGLTLLSRNQMIGLEASEIDYIKYVDLSELTATSGPNNGAFLFALNDGRPETSDLLSWMSDTADLNDGYPVFGEVYTSPSVISFETSGGTPVAAQTVYIGENIPESPVTTKSGFEFDGWYNAASGGSKLTFPFSPSSSMTVYAYWKTSDTGGNGGSSGGSSRDDDTPIPSIVITTTSTGRSTITSTRLDTKIISEAAYGRVSTELMNALLAEIDQEGGGEKGDCVEIVMNFDPQVEKIEVSILQKDLLKFVNDTDAGVSFVTPLITMTFDAKALGTIASAEENGLVVISAELLDPSTLSENLQKKVEGRPVVDINVFNGSTQISELNGGHATISVPYTLKPGEDPDAVVVYYLTDKGDLKTIRGQYNPDTAEVIFKTTHLSSFAVGHNHIVFSDVAKQTWYEDAIDFIAARDIASGTGNNQFSPDAPLTRGQFVVMLLKAYQVDDPVPSTLMTQENFSDAGASYYTKDLLIAKYLGIVSGVGANRFEPERFITRQEIFVMLSNALEVLDALPETMNTSIKVEAFKDAAMIADWAMEASDRMVRSGIVHGINGELRPEALTTRGQMAQLLKNLLLIVE